MSDDGDLTLPGTCPVCGTVHQPEFPHDRGNPVYRQRFFADHGRHPDWHDAMAHCTKDVCIAWQIELARRGIPIGE